MRKFTRFTWLTAIAVAMLLFGGSLVSCAPAVTTATPITPAPTHTPAPTATPTPVAPTPTLDSATVIASPLPPIQQPIFEITPDASQVARWKEYQTVLAACVLSYGHCSHAVPASDSGALCEWDILGRSSQEVYVWAECTNNDDWEGKPVVIYLETDESIRGVKFGGYKGANANLELFPIDVQNKITLYLGRRAYSMRVNELQLHLLYRETHPEELPLIVLSTTPTP